MTPTPRTSLAAHNWVSFSNFVNVGSLTCPFMAKRSTTAEVTIEAESNFGYSRCVERVTPLQLTRSRCFNAGNAQRDDDRVVAQAAITRLLSRQHRLRRVTVAVHSDGAWSTSGEGIGPDPARWHHGRWEVNDGAVCLNAARSLQQSSSR